MTIKPKPKLPRGRPNIGVRDIMVTLDQKTIEAGRALGNGNLSLGLRIALSNLQRRD